jgi:hypothetical protein
MFGKSKRQIKHVTFVQPAKGEAYFYTPIAFATNLRDSKEGDTQVFTDSDLALAGKLKLIFERESMSWFEIREETSASPSKGTRLFGLYYFPQRLVISRASPFDEKATLQDIKQLFDFIVTEEQTRFAEVVQTQMPSAYGSLVGESRKKIERVPAATEEPRQTSEPLPSVVEELLREPDPTPTVEEEFLEEKEHILSTKQRK